MPDPAPSPKARTPKTRAQLVGIIFTTAAIVLIGLVTSVLWTTSRFSATVVHEPHCKTTALNVDPAPPHLSCPTCSGQFAFNGPFEYLQENRAYYRLSWNRYFAYGFALIPILAFGAFVAFTLPRK